MRNLYLNFLVIALIFSTTMPMTANADSSNTLTLISVGTKENTLAVLKEALDKEIPNGVRGPLNLGYNVRFNSLWTGDTEVGAFIAPLYTADSIEPAAYKIMFQHRSEHGFGKSHITSLINKIKEISAKKGTLVIKDSSDQYISLGDQVEKCIDGLEQDVQLTKLKGKLAIKIANISFGMLANDNFPTNEEREAVYILGVKRSECLKPHLLGPELSPNYPLNSLRAMYDDTSTQLFVSMYKGQLSYGAFAKIRKDNATRFDEASRAVMNEAKAKDEASRERAQRMALEQQRLYIEQQKSYAELYKPLPTQELRMPTVTNCNLYGGTMHCTTN